MKSKDEIRKIGESIVAKWLSKKGYVTNIETKTLFGAVGIEAKGPNKNLVILVTPFVETKESALPSYDEIKKVKVHAARFDYEPYEAMLHLDENLRLVGQIQFKRL